MRTIEDRLRDAFRTDADTVRPDTLRPFPDRDHVPDRGSRWLRPVRAQARGRLIIPLTAAAAVAAIAVGAAVVGPGLRPARGNHPAGGLAAPDPGGRLPPGATPRFFVASVYADHGNATELEVVNSATGQVTGRLARPAAHRYFAGVAALGSDQTFVAAAVGVRCDTWFYRFTLSAQGKPTGLTPLSVAEVPGRLSTAASLTVSANGKVLAYASQKCTGKVSRQYLGQVGVVNLAASTTTTWRFRWPATPTNLSLSANGSLLAMVSNPSNGTAGQALEFNSAWVLRTDSAPGPLAQHYRKVVGPPAWPTGAALSPTGKVTFALLPTFHRKAPHWQLTLSAYQTATGRLIRQWHIFPRLHTMTEEPGIVPDVSGDHFLIFSWTNLPEKLDLATGRLVQVPGQASVPPGGVAW
jgi:hypothetical protein